MPPLSRLHLENQALSALPERVVQFGTGVLLRGLPDYLIDKANRQGIFNGRIVVVKSTDGGDAAAFDRQDNLYTLVTKGIENGVLIEESIYKNNQYNGVAVFRDIEGNLVSKGNFVNGKKSGIWQFYEKGKLLKETNMSYPEQKSKMK